MSKRSPNYSPSRHGTGWPSNQPTAPIVAFLDNPNVSDEQRMQVFLDNEVTPPASLGGGQAQARPQPRQVARGVARVAFKVINWTQGVTPELYRRIRNTPAPEIRRPVREAPVSITMNPAPTVTNTIVSDFQPTTSTNPESYNDIFGVRDA